MILVTGALSPQTLQMQSIAACCAAVKPARTSAEMQSQKPFFDDIHASPSLSFALWRDAMPSGHGSHCHAPAMNCELRVCLGARRWHGALGLALQQLQLLLDCLLASQQAESQIDTHFHSKSGTPGVPVLCPFLALSSSHQLCGSTQQCVCQHLFPLVSFPSTASIDTAILHSTKILPQFIQVQFFSFAA
jgi:hypothetical protein